MPHSALHVCERECVRERVCVCVRERERERETERERFNSFIKYLITNNRQMASTEITDSWFHTSPWPILWQLKGRIESDSLQEALSCVSTLSWSSTNSTLSRTTYCTSVIGLGLRSDLGSRLGLELELGLGLGLALLHQFRTIPLNISHACNRVCTFRMCLPPKCHELHTLLQVCGDR